MGWLKLGPSCCKLTRSLTILWPHSPGSTVNRSGSVGASGRRRGAMGVGLPCGMPRHRRITLGAGRGQPRDAAGGIPRQDYDGRDGGQDPPMVADVIGWRSARHNFRTTRVWDRTAVYIAGPAYWIAWVDTCAQEEAAATAENHTILEGAENTGAGVPDTLPEGAIVLFVDRLACASTMPKLLTHHYTEISCAKRRSGLARQVGKTARGNRRVMPHGANEPDIRTGAGRGRGI